MKGLEYLNILYRLCVTANVEAPSADCVGEGESYSN